MDKLKLHTPNLTDENTAKIAALFPHCVTEGKIDFELLKQELSSSMIDGTQERYQLNWVGKREALLNANAPIAKTLRPCRDESVDFDTTENLYIEGDNLDALKLLQETYLNKVKMIYIDPPYNTGNDFIYEDDFAENTADYLQGSNQKDDAGNRLTTNSESNGRFHSDWLSMMYPRLKLARNLLRDDGVIFISIDDNEQANLKRLCDEVFGDDNFVANVVWKHTQQSKNDEKYFSRHYNSIVCYRKSNTLLELSFPRTEEDNKNYSNPDNDKNGDWRSGDVRSPNPRKTLCYKITTPSGKTIYPPENGWRWSETETKRKIESGEIIFNNDETKIIRKIYLNNQEGRTPENIWMGDKFGTTRQANAEIKSLFDSISIFDTPKPTGLIDSICKLFHKEKEFLVLDFFSGSATTAHAVMQLNAEDGGKRKFIMVQIPEACDEKSEAFKAGYKTIADIGKERIRRAGQKIKQALVVEQSSVVGEALVGEALASTGSTFAIPFQTDIVAAKAAPTTAPTIAAKAAPTNAAPTNATPTAKATPASIDIGFRVLKIDSSNMNDVYYSPDAISKEDLHQFIENIKPDRNDEDLLFQVLLDWGVDLSLPIECKTIDSKTVFIVADDAIVACFDRTGGVTETFIKELAKIKPLRAVFCDAGFASDSVKINVEQIFKMMSPSTDIKTI